ncbi:MAG: hypothetical protein AAF959_23020 [Cyanobacteria bacterium P01_D01_bin.56]
MSSLCNPANPTQSLQELMIDCLVDYPNNQQQENNSNTERPSRSVYWADDLSPSGSSSTLSRYHTALAFGATVVCSAGAIMQHTETGFWHQPESIVPENTVRLEQSKADPTVVTPPIASPQTAASFSAGAAADCKDETCKGLAFIDQRLPELQAKVRSLRSEMEQFQANHTAQNLQTHRSILAYRGTDVARRHAELEVRSQQLTQQFSSLTAALAIHPDEAKQVANLLNTDSTYQTALQQLNELQNAISIEYSNPELDNPQLESLYGQYAEIANQLRQTAQNVITHYISTVSVESPDPLWQEDSYHGLFQELIDLAHLRQMLVVEKGTLAKIDEQLTQRRTELAVLLRQYAVLQRQLPGQNKILQQYIAKRQELQNNLT